MPLGSVASKFSIRRFLSTQIIIVVRNQRCVGNSSKATTLFMIIATSKVGLAG